MPIVLSGCCPWTLRPYAVSTLCCELTHTFYRLHLSIYVLWSWKQRGSGFCALLCYQLHLLRPNKGFSGAAKVTSVGPCKSKSLRPISGRLHSHLEHVMKCRNPSGERYNCPVSRAPAVRVFPTFWSRSCPVQAFYRKLLASLTSCPSRPLFAQGSHILTTHSSNIHQHFL